MANLSSLLTTALLLCTAMLTCTARPEPAYFASFTTSPADTLSLVSETIYIRSFVHKCYVDSCVVMYFRFVIYSYNCVSGNDRIKTT